MSGNTIVKTIDSDTLAALEARYAAVAYLIEIDLSSPLYYCHPFPEPLVNGGKTYEPRWFQIDELRWGSAERATCTVTIDNRDDALSDASYTSNLTDGYVLTLHILARPTWVDPWEAVYTPWEGPISQVSGNADAVRVTAAASVGLNARSAHPPMNNYCPYPQQGRFKGSRCGYSGGTTSCDGSWATCTSLSNTARFGGHRFAPDPGAVWRVSTNPGQQTFPQDPQGSPPATGQDGRTYNTDPYGADTAHTGAGDATGGGRPPRGTQGRL